jgi:two-component system NtrC family sensor kinase
LAVEKVPTYVEALENNVVTQFADETERHMAIPFNYGENYIGLILVHDDKPARPFTPREIEVAKALAGQAMRALDNARLHSSLQEKHEELRSMQGKLIENARFTAMGEMAATVAHQINNPLTTIMAEAELLKELEQAGTDRYDQLEAIHRNGKRAADYAKRLLFMVRPTDNKAPVAVNVLESLQEVIGMVSSPRARRGIQLIRKLPKDNDSYPTVMAVQGQLDDVWLNLLNNAYEALEDKQGATITVETRYDAEARQIIVRISDNGPGMPKEVYENIFKPFFTTKDYGTGLGLHICRQIVEQVNGKIEVQSFIGQGTRFTVTLPVVSEKSQAIMQEDTAL